MTNITRRLEQDPPDISQKFRLKKEKINNNNKDNSAEKVPPATPAFLVECNPGGWGDVIFGVRVKCLPPLPWERNLMYKIPNKALSCLVLFSAVFVLEDSKTPG